MTPEQFAALSRVFVSKLKGTPMKSKTPKKEAKKAPKGKKTPKTPEPKTAKGY
jgi:hypothetical protein